MKRVGPGVDVNVPLHSVGQGLFLQGVTDGEERGVRLFATNGELPLANGSNLRFDATFSLEELDTLAALAHELPSEPAPTIGHQG